MAPSTTVRACLQTIGATPDIFVGCAGTDEEFSALKKLYFKKVLATHPDKGGDPALFRVIQEAWEVLRSLYDAGNVPGAGFAFYFVGAGARAEAVTPAGGSGAPTQSYEWFEAAAEEAVPGYKVEAARSGRSECVVKPEAGACAHDSPVIALGEVRVGSLNEEAGSYTRWHHLACWRVPAAVWLGLPPAGHPAAAFEAALVAMQQVVICGYTSLSAAQKRDVLDHIMEPANWAQKTKKSRSAAAPWGSGAAAAAGGGGGYGGGYGGGGASAGAYGGAASPSSYPPHSSTALVPAAGGGGGRGAFIIPRPGVNGAPEHALAGKTFVATGVFPELGGGAGLDLGKERLKKWIESFGGRVTSAVSGKTDYLVVGKDPGAAKVSAAAAKGVHTIDVKGLKEVLEGGAAKSLDEAPAPMITSFSKGFRGNGIGHLIDMPAGPGRRRGRGYEEDFGEYDEEGDDEEFDDEPPPPPKRKPAKPKAPKAAPKAKKARKVAGGGDNDDGDGDPGGDYVPTASRASRAAPKRSRAQ